MAIITMVMIVAIFLVVFQCQPVSGAWRAWDGVFEARCMPISALNRAGAAAGLILSVVVIILPMPPLFSLTMSRRKKAQVIFMFGIGFL